MTEQFKQCPTCGLLQAPSAHFCPKCRHRFTGRTAEPRAPLPRERGGSSALAWTAVGVLSTVLTLGIALAAFVVWLLVGLANAPSGRSPEQPVSQVQPEAPPPRPTLQPIPSTGFPMPSAPAAAPANPGPLPCGDKLRRVDGWYYSGTGGGPVYRCVKGHAYALIDGKWIEIPGGA